MYIDDNLWDDVLHLNVSREKCHKLKHTPHALNAASIDVWTVYVSLNRLVGHLTLADTGWRFPTGILYITKGIVLLIRPIAWSPPIERGSRCWINLYLKSDTKVLISFFYKYRCSSMREFSTPRFPSLAMPGLMILSFSTYRINYATLQ
jgi:hypothetical protein